MLPCFRNTTKGRRHTLTTELRIIIWIIAAIAGVLASAIANTLSEDITYWFVKKGEKPQPKPRRVWVSFSLMTAISILLGSVAAFSPSPANADPLSDDFQVTAEVAQPSATPGGSQPTDAAPLPDPTLLPISATPAWSGVLSLRKATEADINANLPVSIWDANLITVQDMQAPGTMSYSGSAQMNEEYLFSTFWCATNTHQLNLNLPNIETTFFVNGEMIPAETIYTYLYNKSTGWRCSYDVVILGGWLKDQQYTLQIKRVLKNSVSDGQFNYPAGTYINELIVTVE